MERVKFKKKKIIATEGGVSCRPIYGAPMVPQIFFFFYFFYRRRRRRFPKGGAEGADPPEEEGSPAEGGCFASIYIIIDIYIGEVSASHPLDFMYAIIHIERSR